MRNRLISGTFPCVRQLPRNTMGKIQKNLLVRCFRYGKLL
jgi:hypothetical protein